MSEGLVAEGSSSHAGPLVDAIALSTTAPPPPTFASNTDPYTEDFFFPQSVSTRQLVALFNNNNLSCYVAGLSHF
jgi:hypothetical protein